MLDAGFRHVRVLPVRTDFSSLQRARRNVGPQPSDWLYVGRIVPNKCQHQLVAAFAEYRRRFDPEAHLHLPGDQSHADYVEYVETCARREGIEDAVHMPGKVSEFELHQAYRGAGLFVSLSEHEGFGVPLLEAMAAGIPVVAFDSSAVRETMGGGLLLTTKSATHIAALAHVVHTDDELRTRLLDFQDRRLERISGFDVARVLRDTVDECMGRQADSSDRPDPGSIRDQLQPRGAEPRTRARIWTGELMSTSRSTQQKAPATTSRRRRIWRSTQRRRSSSHGRR